MDAITIWQWANPEVRPDVIRSRSPGFHIERAISLVAERNAPVSVRSEDAGEGAENQMIGHLDIK